MNSLRNITVGIAAAAAIAGVAGVAVDQTAAAKAQGTVGEQADGYLGLVSGGSAELQSAVREINTGRAAAYRDIAAKTGVSPEAAGQATAEQLRAKLPSGQYYKPLNGGWTRK